MNRSILVALLCVGAIAGCSRTVIREQPVVQRETVIAPAPAPEPPVERETVVIPR